LINVKVREHICFLLLCFQDILDQKKNKRLREETMTKEEEKKRFFYH
jgi:hypothetical protein